MDQEKIASILPTVIRPEVFRAAVEENLTSDLGGNLLIYYREAWSDGGSYDDMGYRIRDDRHAWAAHCKCTACGYDFYTGWVSAKSSVRAKNEFSRRSIEKGTGIAVFCGEDGMIYNGVPEDSEEYDALICPDGDSVACPDCAVSLTVRHKSQMRGFHDTPVIHRILAGSVENIGPYTALMFWMITRMIHSTGNDSIMVQPNTAAVIDERGTTRMFLYKYVPGGGQWECRPSGYRDPCQVRYYSRGAINGLKLGAWFDTAHIPEQRGQSGEKTGLAEYLSGGGNWPVMYLRFRKRHPNAENLVKAGWMHALESCIDTDVMHWVDRGLQLKEPALADTLVHWKHAKPADMLGMTKQEVRNGTVWNWSFRELNCWQSLTDCGAAGPGDAETLNRYFQIYGIALMEEYAERLTDGEDLCFYEIHRYLCRQKKKFELSPEQGLRYYLDYWHMLTDTLEEAGMLPGPDERYPRDLRAAHDRLASVQKEKGVAGFGTILKRWGALEWTDGEFCARLPRSESELISEGHTLHHCVGGYGRSHVAGKIIIFIRRRRRPERSWYTLNEDLTGTAPRRIQLHGYRNELLNGKHLTIPRTVLDFVDRWEQCVLTPVFRSVRREQTGEKIKSLH